MNTTKRTKDRKDLDKILLLKLRVLHGQICGLVLKCSSARFAILHPRSAFCAALPRWKGIAASNSLVGRSIK
jgi:hypothetical protein